MFLIRDFLRQWKIICKIVYCKDCKKLFHLFHWSVSVRWRFRRTIADGKFLVCLFADNHWLGWTNNHLGISGCSHDHGRVHDNPQDTAYYRWHVSLWFSVSRSRSRFSEGVTSLRPVSPRIHYLKRTCQGDSGLKNKDVISCSELNKKKEKAGYYSREVKYSSLKLPVGNFIFSWKLVLLSS